VYIFVQIQHAGLTYRDPDAYEDENVSQTSLKSSMGLLSNCRDHFLVLLFCELFFCSKPAVSVGCNKSNGLFK